MKYKHIWAPDKTLSYTTIMLYIAYRYILLNMQHSFAIMSDTYTNKCIFNTEDVFEDGFTSIGFGDGQSHWLIFLPILVNTIRIKTRIL